MKIYGIGARIIRLALLWVIGGLLVACSGTVIGGTTTPQQTATPTRFPLVQHPVQTVIVINGTLAPTPVLNPTNTLLKKALDEITSTSVHFVYISSSKHAEGDGFMASGVLQYTVTTTSGKDEVGSINGDWITLLSEHLLGLVYYHNESGQWVYLIWPHVDWIPNDILTAVNALRIKLLKNTDTFQLVGTEQAQGQECLHYEDTDTTAANAGDIWISTNGSHIVQIISSRTSWQSDSTYPVRQIQLNFTNIGVPFTLKATITPY